MISNEFQHQCSSKAIAHNVSIRYKLSKTYLIIDIEPTATDQQHSYLSKIKSYIPYRPNDDSSLTNILIGIGVIVVLLVLLAVAIRLIQMCYKMWQDADEDPPDTAKKSPLLPTTGPHVVRRNSSLRNPNAPIHRSSLNVETQMEIRQKGLSQPRTSLSPVVKRP